MSEILGSRRAETSQNLAMVAYALLFAAVFFAGLPAIIGVVIAYSQRHEANLRLRSHYDFQIRIFWIAFLLTFVAAGCVLTGIIGGLGEIINVASFTSIDALQSVRIDLSHMTVDGRIVALLVVGLLLGFLSSGWIVAASAFGFIRLASERGMGDSPAP